MIKSEDMASGETLKLLKAAVEFELYPEVDRESLKYSE